MPKYLISYRKTEEAGQKPEWTSFTTESDTPLDATAVRERVERRMSVLEEHLWGPGEVVWVGAGRLDDVLYKREEAVVADERVGHADELAPVGGIGEDLLVASHRGVEDHLAVGLAARAQRLAPEHAPIGEGVHRAGAH